jgi:predicted site-specific integrase-resolvase
MKAKEVLKLINVRRETLSRLVRQGRIRTSETPSGAGMNIMRKMF